MEKITSFFDKLREVGAISLKDSYFEVDFNVTHRAGGHARHAASDSITLVNLGPIAFFDWIQIDKL